MKPSDTNDLIQLVYISRRQPSLSEEEVVDDIVFPAMRFNRAHDITGCLWVGKTHFVQILEGGPEVIDTLYARIQKDSRHTKVTLLERQGILNRDYPRFAMRLIRGDAHERVAEIISRWTNGRVITIPVEIDEEPGTVMDPLFRLAGRVAHLLTMHIPIDR